MLHQGLAVSLQTDIVHSAFHQIALQNGAKAKMYRQLKRLA